MQNWTIPLSPGLSERQVGRKAAALGRLMAAGFPVPSGVCVTTDAFRAAASAGPANLRLPDGLLDELTRSLPMDAPLAVRSSSVIEDLPEASLAGRYATHLNVTGAAALEQAVLDCWRSFWAAPTDGCEGCMAVLVQPMLDAECAGVCFTVDPVRLRPDLLLVVSAWGQGAGVVGGSVPSDTARLRRGSLDMVDASVADKHTALRPAPSGGVAPFPVPEDLHAVPCLPAGWLERVGQFGLAIEQLFGAPQDVEWAVAAGQVWILQSRPVTALPSETREAARFPIAWEEEGDARYFWWLEREREFGKPLLPVELEMMRINTRGGHDAVYYSGNADTRLRRCINGRVYMARDKSPHDPGHVRVYGAAQRELQARLARQNVTFWEHNGPEIASATDRLSAFDPREKDGAALADHLEDAVATAHRHWMIHTTAIGRPIRNAALLEAYARISGLRPEDAAGDIPFLLAGSETIQTRLVKMLYNLACLAMDDPAAAKTAALAYRPGGPPVEEPPAAGALHSAPDAVPFASEFSRLMNIYGGRVCYRTVAGYPVDLPLPWKEAPEYVWELVAAYLPLARLDGASPHETRLEACRALDARVEALCAAASDSPLVEDFRRKLDYARRSAAYLDEHNHHIDQLSEGQFLQAMIYAGRALTASGCLPGLFDVFWLTSGEVLDAFRRVAKGTPGSPLDDLSLSLNRTIAERREEYAAWQAFIPPAYLGLPDPRLLDRPAPGPQTPAPTQANLPANALRGEPASRGCASGRARLASMELLPADIAPGDVLVTAFAGPVLIPILPAVAALVLDYGGPGDHFAITAREFRVPVVCATLYATQRIPEGARVTVDAKKGIVSWE